MVLSGLLPGQAQTKVKDSSFFSKSARLQKQFIATSDFLDAAISSVNSFNSLVKKENYRIRIASLNNPTSQDMGFSLENEIQTALKPLLAKAKTINPNKFSTVVSTLFTNQKSTAGLKATLPLANPLMSTLMSLVSNLTVQEKKITREDLDSFMTATSKYFVQYEKLNQANVYFDQNIDKLNSRLRDLQFDIREYLLDIIIVLNPQLQRSSLKNLGTEELLLKNLDKYKLEDAFSTTIIIAVYPSDGIKGAKDISSNLQKLFTEYQKIYQENYQQIRTILIDSKTMGKSINIKQVNASLKDLEELYNDSKASDVMSLRLNTLNERLKVLVSSEQLPAIVR